METIQTNEAPLPVGPYSQAIKTGNFVFVSGQLGINPQTSTLAEGPSEQTKQILKNIEAILKEAGLSKNNIVRTGIYLARIDDFKEVNAVYADFFQDSKPARSTVGGLQLPLGALVEIEAIAINHQ